MSSFEAIALSCLIIACTSFSKVSCDGNSSPNLTSFIFLGQDVSEPIPFIVSIQYRRKPREWKHFCGGSIISANYILTAAHCLVPYLKNDGTKPYRVLAGRNNLKSRIGSRHKITSYKIHPKYYREFNGYDIALLKVQPRFKFNQRTIAKIGFQSSERVLSDITAVFYGWGYTHFGYPDELQGAELRTLSNEMCESEGHDSLTSTDMCARSRDASVPYVGDSGGPLLNENQTLQIGICSYGAWDINNYSFPTVFTRVSVFSKWINAEIRK